MSKIRLTLTVLMILALAGVILLGSVHKPPTERPTKTQPPETLKLAVYHGDFSSLIWVAQEKDYFRKNGLAIQIKEYDSGVIPVNEVLSGRADIATSGEYVAVGKIFNDNRLRILCSIARGDAIEVIARKGVGISRPTDLKQKKIGLKLGSQAEYELAGFLLEHGVALEEVELVDINPVAMEQTILAEDLDAVVVWRPFTQSIKAALKGDAQWWDPAEIPFFFNIITSQDVVSSRKEALQRFLSSLVDAAEFISKNNEAARIIVRDHLDYSDAYSKESWEKLSIKVELAQALILAMENEARWMIKKELTSVRSVPNYNEHFAFSVMEAVHPQGISIIR